MFYFNALLGCVQGCCIFVSGSAKKMPADVKKAFAAVLVQHGGLSAAESEEVLAGMARAKRYVVEAWN